jgi:hypothetical protein
VYYLQRVASHCTRLVSGPHMRLGTELIRGVRHCLHVTRMNSSAMCAHHLPRAATSSRLSGATNSGSAPLSARYCYIDLNQNFQMRISVPPPGQQFTNPSRPANLSGRSRLPLIPTASCIAIAGRELPRASLPPTTPRCAPSPVPTRYVLHTLHLFDEILV